MIQATSPETDTTYGAVNTPQFDSQPAPYEPSQTQVGEEPSKTEEIAGKTKSKLKEESEKIFCKAKESAGKRADEVVEKTHLKVRNFEAATREAAKQLEGTQPGAVSDGAYYVTDKIAEVADYFENHSSAEIADDARSFVRRHPAVALGGLAVVGLALGRFIKAEPEDTTQA